MAAGKPADVRVSRPGKQLFPEDGITKDEFVDYLRTVAETMLPYLRDRPVTLERYPDGYPGRSFFQKAAPDYFPDWIRTVEVAKEGGTVRMAVCDDEATLVYLANQAAVTLHPWLSGVARPHHPDKLILDLDPPDSDFGIVRWAAFTARELFTDIGLQPVVMTTGSRGLHLVLPLDRAADFDAVRKFARQAADLLAGRHPQELTTEVRKNKRRGRLYLDVQRNAYAQTGVAPYSVRARPHAPVATPLDWEELADHAVGPRHWNLRTVPDRLTSHGDPWSGVFRRGHSLTAAGRRLAQLAREEAPRTGSEEQS